MKTLHSIQGVSRLSSQTEDLNLGPQNKKKIPYGAISTKRFVQEIFTPKDFHCYELFKHSEQIKLILFVPTTLFIKFKQ